MIYQIALLLIAVKILFIPLYRSTDFEVHRNWLAITHNLSTDQWYYDTTSEWTLDYPPLFAWLEYGLSCIAKYFDPEMLKVQNINYESQMTILFQRFSVIILDILYIFSVKSCSNLIGKGKLLMFILLVANPGLLMVDHIHFQYNGFLYAFLLFSISSMIQENHIWSAIWFATLLNLKHIYLYIAPAYVVYLLRAYCFTVSSTDGVHTVWYSFSITNLIKLGVTVVSVFFISFGPFIKHIPQVVSRLFPFKRGLCHAYWAPNFWALYNFGDKFLQYIFTPRITWGICSIKIESNMKQCYTRLSHHVNNGVRQRWVENWSVPEFGIEVSINEASMTGGLVQEYKHSVLPSIKPSITFILTMLTMLPALVKLWYLGADKIYRSVSFVRCLTICATCSFMFGWHVHEKAILMILIPLSFLSVLGDVDGRLFLLLSTVGHYSLFPLLYPKYLLPIKVLILLTHCAIGFGNLPALYDVPKAKGAKKRGFLRLPMLGRLESLYLYGLIVLCIYENVFHITLGLDKKLPFLPLMITSVYCAVGVFYFWINYYYYFLTFNLSKVPSQSSTNSTKQNKKVR